jgi:hypothetical protein
MEDEDFKTLNELVFEEINKTAYDKMYDYPLKEIKLKEIMDLKINFKNEKLHFGAEFKKSINIFHTLRNIWMNPKSDLNLLTFLRVNGIVSLKWNPKINRYHYGSIFNRELTNDKIFISKIWKKMNFQFSFEIQSTIITIQPVTSKNICVSSLLILLYWIVMLFYPHC